LYHRTVYISVLRQHLKQKSRFVSNSNFSHGLVVWPQFDRDKNKSLNVHIRHDSFVVGLWASAWFGLNIPSPIKSLMPQVYLCNFSAVPSSGSERSGSSFIDVCRKLFFLTGGARTFSPAASLG
jgi:hypothetical protein